MYSRPEGPLQRAKQQPKKIANKRANSQERQRPTAPKNSTQSQPPITHNPHNNHNHTNHQTSPRPPLGSFCRFAYRKSRSSALGITTPNSTQDLCPNLLKITPSKHAVATTSPKVGFVPQIQSPAAPIPPRPDESKLEKSQRPGQRSPSLHRDYRDEPTPRSGLRNGPGSGSDINTGFSASDVQRKAQQSQNHPPSPPRWPAPFPAHAIAYACDNG